MGSQHHVGESVARLVLACSLALGACSGHDERSECEGERCNGACVPLCPEWLFRDAVSCECEPGCGRGFEWVDDSCVPVGGDADVDTDSDTARCHSDEDCASYGQFYFCERGECVFEVIEYCSDADEDGYAGGGECPVEDCDDHDPYVTDTATRACYSGPAETLDVGPCLAGTETCTNGAWSDGCAGEVLPAPETCDGTDEDCDGVVDQEPTCPD